ncbi:TAP-like protein-domain-containing protein [Clohesyomyces aquaticus]|uniref:TAP-like protein-domain-containing protein n=1 Tax=Clohesyomyces aquaticus TaxID=1231657 RepID=A0A1Y1YI46_9PLEO|nr:TAP-like protein-domain-containing protein [Clohesyomyces aquaticus]
MVYDFAKLTPSPEFSWTPCFGNFTCTLLTVPLDYKNTAAGTTNVAFIKWTAPPSNTTYSTSPQDILINPGGPGGSGVDYLINALPYFIAAGGSQNNYVGFDPRGVNNSGPDLSCFPGRHGTNNLYERELGLPPDVNDPRTLVEQWSRAGAFGEWCSQVHSSGNSTAKYANTVATATDMLHYTELLAKSKGEDATKSKLWYWGVSYGTVLGTTFASLFPSRIGRMVVDGVVDGEDYYAGKWEANVVDADAAVQSFFTYCHDAGASNCPLWASSPSAIESRYHDIIDTLKSRPALVNTPELSDFPTIVTYRDYQNIFLSTLYAPDVYFPILAQGLLALESGNASVIARFTGTGIRPEKCDLPTARSARDLEPLPFIACADANGRYLLNDYDAYVNHVRILANSSHYVGEAWSFLALDCRKLNIRAPSSQVLPDGTYPSASNTSSPLLFVSNTIDPVTPLRSARKMAARFGGAGLLVQDAVGHSSQSTASDCTYEALTKYFANATLPAKDTICKPNGLPFQNGTMAAAGAGLGKRGLVGR